MWDSFHETDMYYLCLPDVTCQVTDGTALLQAAGRICKPDEACQVTDGTALLQAAGRI